MYLCEEYYILKSIIKKLVLCLVLFVLKIYWIQIIYFYPSSKLMSKLET